MQASCYIIINIDIKIVNYKLCIENSYFRHKTILDICSLFSFKILQCTTCRTQRMKVLKTWIILMILMLILMTSWLVLQLIQITRIPVLTFSNLLAAPMLIAHTFHIMSTILNNQHVLLTSSHQSVIPNLL